MYRIQEPPNAIQCEMVEGCNLYCTFCGLQGIRTLKEKNFKFMSVETMGSLSQQIADLGWNPRIEWAMHGENTLHPNYVELVYTMRKHNPKLSLMMTSNGGGLLRNPGPVKNIEALFDAGLNILALDDYKNVQIVPRIREAIFAEGGLKNIEFYDYPAQREGNPHIRAKPGKRMVVVIEDISTAGKGTHSLINNHAGAGSPLNNNAAGKRCAKPFRELSVRWDGSVAICCNDWRGKHKCGNIVTDGLYNVWQSDAFGAARVKLYHGQRDFGACNGCDALSYRVGLLPDKFGKVALPLPDDVVDSHIAAAVSGDPYTKPVLRPWETKA